jgi:hypothetical protein
MTEVRAMREHDAVAIAAPRPPIDLSPFAGTWRKTSDAEQWIDRLAVRIDGGALQVRVFGSAPPSPPDWGSVQAAAIYAAGIDAARGMAFVARYALDECDVELEANVNLGLMVTATFVRWKRGGRANAFTREFFYRSET